jgi:hypothetical protein
MSNYSMSGRWLAVPRALLLGALLLPPSGLAAQETSRFLPSREYLPLLLADPRQPTIAAKLVYATDSPTQFGSIVEGEAAFGASVPLYRLAGSGIENALVLGIEGGVFARFNMETREKDLITTDWVFAVPLVLHRGGSWVRLRYYHTSAHLGDEYMTRFDTTRVVYARDALELLGSWQARPWLDIYGGGGWAFKPDPPEHDPFTLRAGLQAVALKGRTVRPYGAADVLWDQQNDWSPRISMQGGIVLGIAGSSRDVRFGAEFVTGPAPQGQFNSEDTTYLSLGIYLDL